MKVLSILVIMLWIGGFAKADTDPKFASFVKQPSQHVKFCKRWPHHCQRIGTIKRAEFTIDAFAKMDHVNRWGNRAVVDQVDPPGKDEWIFPADGKGDCEDHVIFKRAYLLTKGFSSSQLLKTIVYDRDEGWHMVLTVRTTDGDYILDNLTEEIKRPNETRYTFFFRQSITDPTRWITLDRANISVVRTAHRRQSAK